MPFTYSHEVLLLTVTLSLLDLPIRDRLVQHRAFCRADVMSGKVDGFYTQKRYGLFTRDVSGKDVVVHYSGTVGQEGFKSLKDGDDVAFEITEGEKRPQASNVSLR